MKDNGISAIHKHFSSVDDSRDPMLIDHQMLDMIVVTICAVICGAENWVDVVNWGEEKIDWLRKYVVLANGIPSHDTFRRLFLAIDPEQFQQSFQAWIQHIFQLIQDGVVAIDGKQMRGSGRKNGINPVWIVSAWSTANQLVLAQRRTEEKSNEISAIPQLLQLLDLENTTVTIDAIGCQKENTRIIRQRGGHYLLALKGNQKTLHDDVLFAFDQMGKDDFVGIDADYKRIVSQGHGRIEVRECWAVDDQAQLDFLCSDTWTDLNTIVKMRTHRKQAASETITETYFISSLPCNAERILNTKRAHWGVENNLHWVLDVAFDEDKHQLSGNGAANFAVVRHMAHALLKREKTARGGIKAKRLKAAWSTRYLERLLSP